MSKSRRLRPFNPSLLFGEGEAGVWYDPTDMSTLWQDSARTTRVTADSDPVGAIDDKSGNGRTAIQATAANRPLWRAGGGFPYLQFDGTNDNMTAASVALPLEIYVCLGTDRDASGKGFFIEHGPSANTNNGFYFYGEGNSVARFFRTSGWGIVGTAAWIGDDPAVAELINSNETNTRYRRNGIPQANGLGDGALTASVVTDTLNIYSRNAGALFTQGKLYGLVVASFCSSQPYYDRARLWMAGKCGIGQPN